MKAIGETLGCINDEMLVAIEAEALFWDGIILVLHLNDINQFITALTTSSAYIRLPSETCNQPGIESAVAWIKNVRVEYKHIVLPTDISDISVHNILDLCSIECALLILELLAKSRVVRIMIRNYLDVEIHISQLIQAWESVLENSVCVGRPDSAPHRASVYEPK